MRPHDPDPVKLVVSMFTNEDGLFGAALDRLIRRFGPPDLLSEPLPFDNTVYYEQEFGGGLVRKVASFEGLIEAGGLPRAKLFTNSIEEGLSTQGRRRINIDPGYMALEKFVLASCKNFSHRIFLGHGVYADLTLIYAGKAFQTLPWTYPDYGSTAVTGILKEIRRRYALQLGKG